MNDQIYKNWRKDVGTDYETTRKLVDEDYTRANTSRNTENELVEMNEKLTGATAMNDQPEALRLADALDDLMGEETLIGAVHIDKASYELRRLHAENERLREEGTKFHSNITFIGHFPGSESVEALRLTRNGIWANPDVEIDNTAKIVLAALDAQLKELVQKAVAAEREACAKVCEEIPLPKEAAALTHLPTIERCAAAIRARGEQEKPR